MDFFQLLGLQCLCYVKGKDKLVLGINLGIAACSSVLYLYTVPLDFPSDAWQATGMQ